MYEFDRRSLFPNSKTSQLLAMIEVIGRCEKIPMLFVVQTYQGYEADKPVAHLVQKSELSTNDVREALKRMSLN